MSPVLFTIMFDMLSHMLARSEADYLIKGVKISWGSPAISHLMFADDLTIYTQADESCARNVKYCLKVFSHWS